ncbi:metallophosphoesterase family protein [Sphaerospermopsis kisseleviana CS-549]|uniref:Metallophosphoesterase family protein n=1 Tax=Sphaerospermopsis kisseleviana CS-549 TaxID=3021783 RepID=A0ABT4ZLK7_9CYAN|nr:MULTISPECIES: metallophosphoesterase family protein [Sphaerospermopsis]MBD2131489.1 serine/threonine protein phosphatase [Sphaerospermopsis sp. FACHB-1094]MBD2147157.1 serine/threonine protein phosphatase [Sphaerospermopsis sp. FACHB-1194]MDB9439989.1 metallophosphoesterase family protein [Sphaerospermopsis kisseleviana CS-549]BAZ83490.1 metallophosphoesterase [Sphaerospermopsis kisseleviana NIES-73]
MSETRPRRIIIGDVHGYYQGLMILLKEFAPTSEDQVYFLGDLIDRGPQSAQVVDFVKKNNYPCLLGNHELMLLSVMSKDFNSNQTIQAWLYSGGQATITSYQSAQIPQDHLDWLANLPTYLDLGDVWLTHAGVDPRKSVSEQTSQELCWIRDEFHSMELPYFSNKLIIVGHTITFTLPGVAPGQLAQGEGWLDIDTGAYHPRSGWLTGLDITNNLVYQANVFNNKVRTLPLEKAVTRISPHQIQVSRRHKQRVY